MAHDLVTELLQYSSLACFMAIWQLCANLLIPNCLRSNLSYSPLAALELYVKGGTLENFYLKPKEGSLFFWDLTDKYKEAYPQVTKVELVWAAAKHF